MTLGKIGLNSGRGDFSSVLVIAESENASLNKEETIMSDNHPHGCLFCDVQTIDQTRIVEENDLAFVVRDGFPVTEHHSLLIPKRHVLDYFGLTVPEVTAIHALLLSQKEYLNKIDPSIDGFNIGMNCGKTAGQSVWHCHVHLIPRRIGDVEFPKGGVRHVIPYKGNYEDLR